MTVSNPSITKSGMMGRIQALWAYRTFVTSMVARELRARYMGSLLGGLWALITPLVLILIYMLVFSEVMRGKLADGSGKPVDYGLFLCTGILIWGYFSEVVTNCQGVFLEYSNLLKKMSFPRITLPVIVLLTATFNFLLVAILFVILLLILGRFPGAAMVSFVPLLIVQQGLAVGLGILLGTLHVFFRDIGQAWTVGLTLWFWLTPIVYHIEIIPEQYRSLVMLNPLTPLFLSYQNIVLQGLWPDWRTIVYPTVVAFLILTAGLGVFRRLSGEMVDEL